MPIIDAQIHPYEANTPKRPWVSTPNWPPSATADGIERCLWGTDWTRASAVVNYEQATKPFLETDRLSEAERAMLMGGACAKAYRWAPSGRSPR